MVGFDTADDACVYRLTDGRALIQTVDFFPPMVDDPFSFGQIAAANALSDVYAMGGVPALAMNLLCVPNCLPVSIIEQILAGGYSKVQEAGAFVAGGHTIQDQEPKYGLCVTGFAKQDEILTNRSARPGDLLVLTKPIGSGILSTAVKQGQLTKELEQNMIAIMTGLNRSARDGAVRFGAHACTDITGFGLIGHSYETAHGSNVTIRLASSEIPIMEGAEYYALQGSIPGGMKRNLEYLNDKISFENNVSEQIRSLMLDPQTSGGLLISIAEEKAHDLVEMLKGKTACAKIIGRVLPFDGKYVRII